MSQYNRKGIFKKISEKRAYRARIFELKVLKMRAPDGHMFQHDIVFHPGAAVIVPLLKPDQFVLVRQYRTAVQKVIWEFPAGTLEHREMPLACAKREIVEETGFKATRWKKLISFYPAPGVSTEFMHIFLASGLIPAKVALDQDEFITRKIVSFAHLQKMVLNGTIVDAKTIIGFFYYCQNYKKKSSLSF